MNRRQRRRRGFSLLETLVALAISAAALVIAIQVLAAATATGAHAARQARDPLAAVALDQLRADLVLASAAVADGLWDRGELELIGHPVGDVRYAHAGGTLSRVVNGSVRPLMDRVVTFRWRRVAGGVIEVELGYRETAPLARMVAGGTREEPVLKLRTETISATPRAGERFTSFW